MKELRELYNKGTQGEWCSLHHYNDVFVAENTTVCTTQNGDDADLIAAMHNALPELLDAWEMVQALEWAKQWNVQNSEPDTCHNCPLRKRCFSQETGFMYLCLHAVKFSNEWRAAYREAQKNEWVE